MINVIQNGSVTFNIRELLTDRGWVILSPTSVKHSGRNKGSVDITYFPIEADSTYDYSFEIEELMSGSIRVDIGGAFATEVSANGYHQGTVTTVSGSPIKITGIGDSIVKNFTISKKITEDVIDGKNDTVTWSEHRKGWVTFKDLLPDSGFSMWTKMFTLKEGNLWVHTTEDGVPSNNFYGHQYSSKVKFPVSSVGVKTYHTIALHSNKILGATEDGITTELGQVSDLITYDFNTREGVHYANKLRDRILDDKLKGRYIVVELTDEETKGEYLQIFKIVIKSEMSTPSE